MKKKATDYDSMLNDLPKSTILDLVCPFLETLDHRVQEKFVDLVQSISINEKADTMRDTKKQLKLFSELSIPNELVGLDTLTSLTGRLRQDRSRPSFLHLLPDGILLWVFSFVDFPEDLNNLMLVCKRFRLLCQHPSLWHRMDLRTYSPSDEVLGHLAIKHTCITELKLAYCNDITDFGLKRVGTYCKGLEVFDITGNHEVTDSTLRAFADKCFNLRHVNVAQCSLISDFGVKALAFGCKKLQYLNVSRCPKIGDASLWALADGSNTLEVFNGTMCHSITDAGVVRLGKGSCAPTLRQLYLSGSLVTDAGLHSISVGVNTSLRLLDLTGCNDQAKQITDVGLYHIAERSSRIQTLQLAGCQHLTDFGLEATFVRCCAIKHLNLSGVELATDAIMEVIAQSLLNLHYLDISNCWQVTNAGVTHTYQGNRRLEYLNIQGTDTTPWILNMLKRYLPNCVIRHSHAVSR